MKPSEDKDNLETSQTGENNDGVTKAESSVIDHSDPAAPEKHHEEHGNRKYKMFTNHSSADDQPRVDTGTP